MVATTGNVRSLSIVALVFALLGHSYANEPHALPRRFDFTQPRVPDGWEVCEPEGTSVVPKDGLLIFESPADRYAGVEYSLDVDNVTVTARIQDAATVYLVWDDANFVGAGKVSPTPFARFHSLDARDSHINECDHTGCAGYAPHLIRVQLGKDCIRFQYANTTGEPAWTTLRTIERSQEYAAPPRRIVIGKNLGVTKDAATLVNTDSVGRGNRGLLAEVEIDETPKELLRMNADERRWLTTPQLDPIAQLLTDSDRDPTFEQVARFYPEMKYKRELVGVPGQRLDIGTDWLGRIDANPWEGPIAWFEIGEEAYPFAERPEQVSHRLLDGYLPIVTLKTRQREIDYDMTVFGWSDDFSATNDLYTYVRITAWDNGETTTLPTVISLIGKEQKRVAFKPETSLAGILSLCLRFKHPDPKTSEQITEQEFEEQRAKAATAWRDTLAQCSPFELPDPRVDDAYRAWLAYSMLNADRIDGKLEVHDGAGFYDMQYGYSVALHAMALDLYRLPKYVAEILSTQVSLQKPNGHYIQECGLPDHGGFVLAHANHYLVTRDKEWLRQNVDAIKRACDWILDRRAESPTDGMCKGLIKFRPYNDYNDPVFNYQGNIYCCQGLEAAATALSELGDVAIANRYAAEGTQYRRDILDSMDAATFTHNGVQMIPIEPDTQRLLKLTKYKGGEYYGLVASTLFENMFFPPNDTRAALFRNMLENEGGLTAGVTEFQEGIDHAYAYGYLLDRLRAGEIRKVILGFWSFMAYGMTRDTYSPVEVTLYKTGDNHYTLPHTYSCTQQLRLLRNMLVREEGSELILGQGIPEDWLQPTKRIAVTDAPTLFGPVSFCIETLDSRTAQLHIDPPTRLIPSEIRVHLRQPKNRKITEVQSVDGIKRIVEGNVIRLPNLAQPVDLRVSFADAE